MAKGGAGAPQDASGVASAVQNFLNSVISMTGWGARGAWLARRQWVGTVEMRDPARGQGAVWSTAQLCDSWRSFVLSQTPLIPSKRYGGTAAQQQTDALRSSVAAQFAAEGAAVGSPSADPRAPPPAPPPQLALPDAAPAAVAAPQGGGASVSGVSGASSEASDDDDKERFKLGQAAAAAEGSGASQPGAGSAHAQHGHHHHHHHHGGAHHHGGGAGGVGQQGSGLLLKDAFLVFRALCKLSIRTSDSATVQDPTAVRGKVGHGRCGRGNGAGALLARPRLGRRAAGQPRAARHKLGAAQV